jgi:hypothetical protein
MEGRGEMREWEGLQEHTFFTNAVETAANRLCEESM